MNVECTLGRVAEFAARRIGALEHDGLEEE